MKRKRFMSLLVATMLLWGVIPAGAYVINDAYWGGTPTNFWANRDIVGNAKYFDVDRMEVTFGPQGMVIDIFSTYLDNIGMYGTELGDLFISVDGWNPTGNASYTEDSYALGGETWEYALVMDDHTPSVQSGLASLYMIPQNTYGNHLVLSSATLAYDVYREGQEVQLNPAGLTSVATGAWSIGNLGGSTDTDDYLRFVIDYDFGPVPEYGFHWTMTCGNDVIEGSAPVPEPATMLLLGTGLIGLGALGRKRISGLKSALK